MLKTDFEDLRDLWTLITARQGLSYRAIGYQMGWTLAKTRRLVLILLYSGTLVMEEGKSGTLRATVPMIYYKPR